MRLLWNLLNHSKVHARSLMLRKKILVTLLSAPLSSEQPLCITTLFRKRLICPMLFGLWKSGKKDGVLHSLGNRKICKSQSFSLGWLCKSFFKTICFQKSGFISKTQFFVFFRYVFSYVVDHNFTMSDCKS